MRRPTAPLPSVRSLARAALVAGVALASSAAAAQPTLFVDGFESATLDAWDPLAPLDDEFSAPLSGWSTLNGDLATIGTAGGWLAIEPTAYSLWYQNSAGILLSKEVTGDFRVTAALSVRRRTAPSEPPAAAISLGGLMLRDPDATGGEDYVFLVLGYDVDDLSVERKTTDDGVSTYVGPPWPTASGELRLCRLGAAVSVYVRPGAGDPWQLQATYDRPDLPAAVQVGANVYAAQASPDLRVSYDFVRFRRVAGVEDCAAD